MGPEVRTSESWTRLGTREIHAWHVAGTPTADGPLVALLPGLGLPAYAAPAVRAIAASGASCVLLDLPGFGRRGTRGATPGIDAVGRVAAEWIRRQAGERPLVVAGHSTGAQAALTAALCLQDERPHAALVMAGPTFIPPHRRLPSLLRSTPRAYRDDSLRELKVLPAIGRGRLGVWSMLRSGMRDAPEHRIAELRLGVTLTAGRSDAFAPRWWLELLGASASRAAYARVVQTAGSHNNLFTHPLHIRDVVVTALGEREDGVNG